jgi:hypothetical protein
MMLRYSTPHCRPHFISCHLVILLGPRLTRSQFFAIEHANNTGPGGGFRSFASTNYTLVANASEAGQWTPPRLSGAEALRLGR